MDLRQLMGNNHSAPKGAFTVRGEYGDITAWPDGHQRNNASNKVEPTYWVDITYLIEGSSTPIHLYDNGFRQSTVFCLCAGVCVGERALNSQLIDELNCWFDAA